jgi:hypothetical protein
MIRIRKTANFGALTAFDMKKWVRSSGNAGLRQRPDRSDDPSKFAAGLTAFMDDDPPDWVIAAFYPVGFPPQDAQSGAYTVTARFGRDHADALQSLLNDPSKQCRCVIPAKLNRQ